MKTIRENIMVILAIIGVLAPLSLLGILIYKEVEPTALVAGFIGVVVGSYSMIFQYYFGSSSGSKSKQEMIDKIVPAPAPADADPDPNKKIWKDSGSTLSFEEWTKRQKEWKDSGSTLSFDDWIKEQK